MHSDERAELKNNFYLYLDSMGWNHYQRSEKIARKTINFFFRILHIFSMISILGLAFASMRHYISRQYGWLALILVIVWLFIERINLRKLDNLLLKKKQKKLLINFKEGNVFEQKLAQFAKLDIIPEQINEKIQKALKEDNAVDLIQQLHVVFFYLTTVKTLEESQHNIAENYFNNNELDELN